MKAKFLAIVLGGIILGVAVWLPMGGQGAQPSKQAPISNQKIAPQGPSKEVVDKQTPASGTSSKTNSSKASLPAGGSTSTSTSGSTSSSGTLPNMNFGGGDDNGGDGGHHDRNGGGDNGNKDD